MVFVINLTNFTKKIVSDILWYLTAVYPIAVMCECIHGDQLKIHQGPKISTKVFFNLLSGDP